MHWGWDWVDCFWNKVLLEHSMFLQLSSFSQKSSLLNIFSLCKKSLNFDTLFWAFPAWKLVQKGASITEIRTGLLIIVFKWICVYSLGAFFFCVQFAMGIFFAVDFHLLILLRSLSYVFLSLWELSLFSGQKIWLLHCSVGGFCVAFVWKCYCSWSFMLN